MNMNCYLEYFNFVVLAALLGTTSVLKSKIFLES
jgi:hypothetical protein